MGLITIKALKPAAGEQNTLGSEYALTLMDVFTQGGGVMQFYSYATTSGMNVGVNDDGQPEQLYGAAFTAEMNVGVSDDGQPIQLNGIAADNSMNVSVIGST